MNYAIYGAGGNGKILFSLLKKMQIDVSFFIDLYCTEQEYCGIPIFRPNEVSDKATPVLVSISCFSEQVKQQLLGNGHLCCFNLNEVIKMFPELLDEFIDPRRKQELIESVLHHKNQYDYVEQLLEDDSSRQVLKRIIAFRTDPCAEHYLENDWETQYFPDKLLTKGLIQTPFRMVDCGAYNGDTLSVVCELSANKQIDVGCVICFEPEVDNFKKLVQRVQSDNYTNKNVILYPCGVWSENSILYFKPGQDQSHITTISDEETISIPVMSLDNTCYGIRPNFIKMDVEGAEIAALHGSSKIIAEFNPTLAISVYHRPEHLWQIPQLIQEINPNYHYYLHAHGDFGYEIVLYAIPK